MIRQKRNSKAPLHIVAAVGVVVSGDKFLAGMRDPNDQSYPGKYALPGGKVEVGESIEEALRQEVFEEAGVQIKNIIYVTEFNSRGNLELRENNLPVIGLIFVCDYDSGQVRPGDDMVTAEWMTLEDAEKKDFIPGTLEEVRQAFAVYKSVKRKQS